VNFVLPHIRALMWSEIRGSRGLAELLSSSSIVLYIRCCTIL